MSTASDSTLPGRVRRRRPTGSAVVDLLAALAYSELSAFERLADDSTLAPPSPTRRPWPRWPAPSSATSRPSRNGSPRLSVDPYAVMAPFRKAVDDFHEYTAPRDWLEGLVKAYVGDNLAADFYRQVAEFLDADTKALIVGTLDDTGHSQFAVDRIRAAIAADPRIAGRLALWGRRLMGEALSQAQRVAADRDSLTALIAGGVDRPGMDLAAIGRMFAKLTANHTERMAVIGLQA